MSSTASDSLEFCSMDYWDYFVELECLQNSKGKDLQLAAELGKTLLERNKELETGLKQQQSVIDDQSQEIEYLSKQSVALREVNDSRLRVYEQLEVSIQELEVTNQRLQAESGHDKKQIRSLGQTVDCLETRGAELQALVDELRADVRTRRSAVCAEHQCGSPDRRDSQHRSRADELAERVALLEHQLAEWRERERLERERRLRCEAESVAALEESAELHREMAALRERSIKLHTLAEEVHAMEEHRLTPFLQRCSQRDCDTSPQMAGQSSKVAAPSWAGCSPTPPPTRSVWGDQTAVLWPTLEASPPPPAGHQLVSTRPEAPRSDCGQLSPAPASLINDLDAHYRVLLDEMDKYEWLLCSRQPRASSADQPSSLSLLQELQELQQSCVDGSAGQEGAVRRDAGTAPPPRDSGPDSLMLLAASSDGDASSSGFSEGSSDSRTVSRATQTPEAPAPPHAAPLSRQLTSGRFQHTPQYKQLFQEIFEVLKKPAVVELPARVSEPEPVLESTGPLEAVQVAAHPAPADDALALVANAWKFSYTQEFEKCLKASESSPMNTSCTRGTAEAAPGAVPLECEAEEFPHLSRPSEDVAKLRLLERSYAEALKAGRRVNRASRCQMSNLTSE